MKFDEDQIVEGGLFYCVPWMRQAQDRIAALERALDRHGTFHDVAVSLVRDMRLALLRGDYLMKQQMDARSDAWLKEVDGPRPIRSTPNPQADSAPDTQ